MADPGPSRPLRALLPSTHQPPSVDGAQSRPPSPQPSLQSQATPKGRGQRQQISVACTNCHQKKRRCDGKRPCGACSNSSLSCFYEIESGLTRSQALKRRNEALAEDNNQLRYIVQGLRGGSEPEINEILRRIRDSRNVDEAVSMISEAALLLPKTYTVDTTVPQEAQRFFDTTGASNPPLPSLPIAPPPPQQPLNDAAQGSDRPSSLDSSSPTQAFVSPATTHHSSVVSLRRSNSMTGLSSTLSSDRAHTEISKGQPLLRWMAFNPASDEHLTPLVQHAGTADRLNALLDNLPFLGSRPIQTPSTRMDTEQFYLPIITVSAYPWTHITNDDDLVNQLLLLFFTWEQPCYNFVEMTAFFEDMKSVQDISNWAQPPEREFCSQALVNALLALGALSSRHPMACAVPGNLSTRGWHFLEEAERLIRADLGRPRITTLQAMWLTMWYRGTCGYRFRSNEFHEAFYRMYEALGLGREQQRPANYKIDRLTRMYWNARSEVIWGIYCQESVHSVTYGSPARLRRPLIEKTFKHDGIQRNKEVAAQLWYPYPEPQAPQPSLRHECLNAKADLTDIVQEMLAFLHGYAMSTPTSASDVARVRDAMRIYGKFVAWQETLPEVLGQDGSKLPHILQLRASYDVAVITLFRSLQDVDASFGNNMWDHPRHKVVTHSQTLMMTMNTLRNHWTLFRHCYAMQAHWLPAFALLFHLRLGEPVADVFSQAIRGLHEVGQKWAVAAWMLQVVHGIAKQYNLKLPKSCRKWLEIDRLQNEDLEVSDVMLPVTIPESFQMENPMVLGKQVGIYLDNLDSVLNKLDNLAMGR